MTSSTHESAQSFTDLLTLIESRRSLAPFVVAIEGRGGAGKSTLAAHLASRVDDSAVVPMDDFLRKDRLRDPRLEEHYDVGRVEREVLIPFTQGLAINYRRLDWETGDLVPIAGIIDSTALILEGICSYSPPLRHYVDLRVWVETPSTVATRRGILRDAGTENELLWPLWQSADTDYIRRETPDALADIVVSGI